METGTMRWIAVGVDGSEPSLRAVDWAAAEAAERGMSLRVCHVSDQPEETGRAAGPAGETGRQHDGGPEVLRVATERAHQVAPGLAVEGVLRTGHCASHAEALITLASGAEALVIGSHGRGGLTAALLGSVSEHIVHHGRGPVLVVRGPRRFGPIAVGVDGSAESQAALGFAFARADELGVGIRALHAYSLTMAIPRMGYVPDFEVEQVAGAARDTLDSALAPWTEKYPDVPVTRQTVDDSASVVLVEQSRDCGLLVVGSRGRGGVAGLLLGSVSRHAIRHADCPVAVVRH